MAQNCSIKLVEHSHVSPPPGSVPTTSLPLTFFDTLFLSCCNMQRLFFFEFPYPSSHFIQNYLPNLKHSLSLTLQRFFPFAGNLRLPSSPQRPYIYYADGGFVPFVVNESKTDMFKHLIGHDQIPRRGDEFEDLVPKLAPLTMYSDEDNSYKQLQPLMAIQVTIFPNVGISIGLTFCHVVADGKAFSHFTKSWASICRSAGDLSFVNNSLPDYSRELIQDPRGIWSIFLNEMVDVDQTSTRKTLAENVRISPVISKTNVEMLKKWIARKCLEENDDPPRLSTFVVTTAFMWACLIKLLHQSEKISDQLLRNDDRNCAFIFLADCRDRLRLPTNYFGNCVKPCIVTAKRSELIGENGILLAAKAISREIQEFEKEPLAENWNWISNGRKIVSGCEHRVTLAGSPKFKVYETDFGFGRPIKSEVVHISCHGSVGIGESRDEEGGLEFGLALASADELDKFNAIFEQCILKLNL